jgi:hypothetical protein
VTRVLLLAVAAAAAFGCASLRGPIALGPPELPEPGQTPSRLVLVTLHGLAPSHYLAAEPVMPVLADLAMHGAAAEVMTTGVPATVYAAHATLVTGVDPALHGITGDRRLDERGISAFRLDQAADVQAQTLFTAIRGRHERVAALDWPSTGGAPIDDLAPDLELAEGASWRETLARLGTGRVGELSLRIGAKDGATNRPGAERDTALVTLACGILTGDPAPRLLALRLSRTAEALASHPAGGQEAEAAFRKADADLGRLVRCLSDAGLLSMTAIAVAGDFGVAPVHTELRPNAVLAGAGLLVPAGDATQSWGAIARANGSSAFVYATDADSALLARRAADLFATETRTLRVLSAKEMVARGADPEAWFGLETEPGFVFADGTEGPPMRPSTVANGSVTAAGHEARGATGFVAWGPGVRPGIRIPNMRQIDVAPTLAYWMSVGLEAAQGRALVGLFGRGGP